MSDLIRREDAIDALEARKDKTAKGDIGQFYNTIIQRDIVALIDLPTIDAVEVVRCKWKIDEYGIYHCPICHAINNTVYKSFCPNCGMRSDGEEQEDDNT